MRFFEALGIFTPEDYKDERMVTDLTLSCEEVVWNSLPLDDRLYLKSKGVDMLVIEAKAKPIKKPELKCSVEGCTLPYCAKGYCFTHYQAQRRALPGVRETERESEREYDRERRKK
jgi:hypothetical protein